MLKLRTTSQFRKDLKRIKKRNVDMTLLEDVISILLKQESLPAQYLDHALKCSSRGIISALESVTLNPIGFLSMPLMKKC